MTISDQTTPAATPPPRPPYFTTLPPGLESWEAIEYHPYATVLPLDSSDRRLEQRESMRTSGQFDPITLIASETSGGPPLLLDGRHRIENCIELGLAPKWVWLDPDADPLEYVKAKGLYRRDLSPSQRAAAAVEFASLPPCRPTKAGRSAGVSQAEAAAATGASPRTVRKAAAVKRSAPEAFEKVRDGQLSVDAAVELARLPKDRQREIVQSLDTGVVRDVAKAIRKESKAARRTQRVEKIAHRAQAPALEGLPRRFPIVVADPPWSYGLEPDAEDFGGPSQHYPPLTDDEIMALPVSEIAAKDAALFLWCTGTVVADGLARRVAIAWGFSPVSLIPWDKNPGSGLRCRGMGHWTQQDAEYILVARRGDMPPPPPDRRLPSPLREKSSGRHSEKPPGWYHAVVRAYPDLDRIEIFARDPRLGYAAWGNETGFIDVLACDRTRAIRAADDYRAQRLAAVPSGPADESAPPAGFELLPISAVEQLQDALDVGDHLSPEDLVDQALEKIVALEGGLARLELDQSESAVEAQGAAATTASASEVEQLAQAIRAGISMGPDSPSSGPELIPWDDLPEADRASYVRMARRALNSMGRGVEIQLEDGTSVVRRSAPPQAEASDPPISPLTPSCQFCGGLVDTGRELATGERMPGHVHCILRHLGIGRMPKGSQWTPSEGQWREIQRLAEAASAGVPLSDVRGPTAKILQHWKIADLDRKPSPHRLVVTRVGHELWRWRAAFGVSA